ncbi:hypothetical protein LDO31_03005 [Luteimonas sp. XNQY3]|nr:hypothetical protein [Luteimonas sp. XNQY3]MCD9005216.1 hypothetical protein [Luteimonas sp. XNQY3]
MKNLVRVGEHGIAAVRVRLGTFGRPVIQVQRSRSKRWLFGRPSGEPPVSQISNTEWRDAGKADAIELAQFLVGLQAQQTIDVADIDYPAPVHAAAALRPGSNGPAPSSRPAPPPNPPAPHGYEPPARSPDPEEG